MDRWINRWIDELNDRYIDIVTLSHLRSKQNSSGYKSDITLAMEC